MYIVLHSHFAYFECKSLENALLMTLVNIQLSFIWLRYFISIRITIVHQFCGCDIYIS